MASVGCHLVWSLGKVLGSVSDQYGQYISGMSYGVRGSVGVILGQWVSPEVIGVNGVIYGIWGFIWD